MQLMQSTSSLLLTKSPREMYFTVLSEFTAQGKRKEDDIVTRILFLFPFSLIRDDELRKRFLLSSDCNPKFVETALLPLEKQVEAHSKSYPDHLPYVALSERKNGEVVIKGISTMMFRNRWHTTPTIFFDKYITDFKALFSPTSSSVTHTATSTRLSSTRVKQIDRPEIGTTTYLTSVEGVSESISMADQITNSHKFTREMGAFFRLLITQIQLQPSTISPYDSLWMTFEILTQNAIVNSHFSPEEKQLLSERTYNLFERLFSHFCIIMSCINNDPSPKMSPVILKMLEQCQGVISELQNLTNSFLSSPAESGSAIETAPSCSSTVKESCEIGLSLGSLINILIDGSQIRDPRKYDATYLSYAINEISNYFRRPLNQLTEHLKLTATITPKGLKNILILRANILNDQLGRGSQNKSPEMQPCIVEWSALAESLSLSIQEEKWVDAWRIIDRLSTDFKERKPTGRKDLITLELQKILLYSLIVNSIYDNFVHFVRSDKISMLIADASEDIRLAYERLRQFSSPSYNDPELQSWIKEVKQTASKEFRAALKNFNLKLNQLEEMRENLNQCARLSEIFRSSPLEQVEKELWIAKELDDILQPFFKDWIIHLHDINKLVPYLQNTFLSHLFSPTTSVCDLDLLRKKFEQFNTRLQLVVEPTANLLAAYEKLTQFKFLTPPSLPSSSSEGVDRLTVDSKSLGQIQLKLFATDSDTFTSFRENLEAFQRESESLPTIFPITLSEEQENPPIETESSMNSPTIMPAESSSSGPTKAISNAF
ncbi:MAG: hypothetical protein ACHQUC_06040 [Chlamydiales bacterium]